MNMLGLDDEGEDAFFDPCDCIRTSIDSASSVENLSESLESGDFGKFQSCLWTEEFMSVHERRKRFLKGIGFDEFLFAQADMPQEIKDNIEFDRVLETTGAVSNSLLSADDRQYRESHCCIRDLDSGKRFIVHDRGQDSLLSILEEVGSERRMTLQEFEAFLGISNSVRQFMKREPAVAKEKQNGSLDAKKKGSRSWWRSLNWKRHSGGMCKNDISVKNSSSPNPVRMKVRKHKKRCMEFTALFMGQEIKGHDGLIRTMKFSSSGWYLASGGEDSVVRIWQVIEAEASSKSFPSNVSSSVIDKIKDGKLMLGGINCTSAPVVIPTKIFKIKETPVHELRGHTGGILDLSWSKSEYLLSSSKDKTVRMWKVGCDACVKIFQHNDFVTCVQFNPIDERYFITGSIDGKVRVWGIPENRVVDWVDIRYIVTAVCYQPDGKGFVVGSITGNCWFYDQSDSNLRLDTRLCVSRRKKTTAKHITCLQFSPSNSEKVMISSADSRIRVFDGVEVIHKFRGLRRSKSQLSASFTSDGRYIVSVDADSHVYIWNYKESCAASKEAKTLRSCELFSSKGASVAVPWPGVDRRCGCTGFNSGFVASSPQKILEPSTWLRNPECFSLGVWFLADSLLRGSATWPEETLMSSAEQSRRHDRSHLHRRHSDLQQHFHYLTTLSATWSLVIVTASDDGSIRSFHNYGLPVRL